MTKLKIMPHAVGAYLKGVGVENVELDANNHLIVYLDNGEIVDAGEFKVDDEVTSGSKKPVAGGALYQALASKVDKISGKGLSTNDYTDEDKEEVDTVRKVLWSSTNVDLSEAVVGIWEVKTNTLLSISGFYTIKVPINGRCKVSYSGHSGGNSMAMIIVRDAGGNIINIYDRGDGSYTERSGTIYIEESEATEVIFTYRSNVGSPYLHIYELIDFDSFAQRVDDAEMICEDYIATRKDFIAKKSPNLWDGTTIDKVISSGGGLTEVSSWKENKSSTPIEVKPNAYYYLSGRPAGISTKAIRCLSELDGVGVKVLSPVTNTEYAGSFNLPNDDATDIKVNGMFKTPSNAKYVQFVVAAGNPYNYDKVMLEYVGEEYDGDFQPSPYQPYNPVEIIKKDKLPSDIPNTNADNAVARKYPLRVLLIGSSHGMNSISQVPWICQKSGFDVTVGNVYKGSLTLQQIATAIEGNTSIGGWFKVFADGAWHTEETTLFDDVMRYADWDFIIVQRSASDDNIWTKDQSDALFTIVSRINEVSTNTPTILFNSGFADPSANADTQKEMTRTIMSTAMDMQLEHQIEVIPIATAIQNARGTSLANIGAHTHKDMCYDSQHLDYGIGCYVASATIVQTILAKYGWDILTMKGYGTYDEAKSFVDTLVDTGGEGVAYTEPTNETMRIAKLCAKAAYLKPTEVNDRLSELFS
jgi:hypothetical protein